MLDFIMLCGLPYTGKSYFREKYLSAVPDLVHVCSDDLIERWSEEDGIMYNEGFIRHKREADMCAGATLKRAIEERQSVVVDRTFLSPHVRENWMKYVDRARIDYRVNAIVFDCDSQTRVSRVALRPHRRVPIDILESMAQAWQPPTLAEGFNHIFTPSDFGNWED